MIEKNNQNVLTNCTELCKKVTPTEQKYISTRIPKKQCEPFAKQCKTLMEK